MRRKQKRPSSAAKRPKKPMVLIDTSGKTLNQVIEEATRMAREAGLLTEDEDELSSKP